LCIQQYAFGKNDVIYLSLETMGKLSSVKANAAKDAVKPPLPEGSAPTGMPAWDDLPENDRLFLLRSLQDVKDGRIVSWDEAEMKLNTLLDA